MADVADAVAETPGLVSVEGEDFTAADIVGEDDGLSFAAEALGLHLCGGVEGGGCVRDGGSGGTIVGRFGIGDDFRAGTRGEDREAPVAIGERTPEMLVLADAARLLHHGVDAARGGEGDGIGLLRGGPVVRPARLAERSSAISTGRGRVVEGEEGGKRRVGREGMRHGARAGDGDEKGAAVGDAFGEVRLHGVREDVRADVAEDDDVELAPLLGALGEGAGLGLAEGARRGGGRRTVRHVHAVDGVGVEQHILEVDGLVAGVEEIAQVAEVPARVVVDEQDVGAVVADGDVDLPGVVGGEAFALEVLD